MGRPCVSISETQGKPFELAGGFLGQPFEPATGGFSGQGGISMALTKRQKEVLNYLVGFINKNGYSPSFEEIAHALKLTSLATVHKHLSTLEKKGYIRRGYNQSRSIEVVQLPKQVREEVLDRHVIELPLAGRIA